MAFRPCLIVHRILPELSTPRRPYQYTIFWLGSSKIQVTKVAQADKFLRPFMACQDLSRTKHQTLAMISVCLNSTVESTQKTMSTRRLLPEQPTGAIASFLDAARPQGATDLRDKLYSVVRICRERYHQPLQPVISSGAATRRSYSVTL